MDGDTGRRTEPMQSTRRKNFLLLTTLSIIVSVTYAALVAADYAAFSFIARSDRSFGQSEAASIVEARQKSEDVPQRAIAIREGYAPVMHLNFVQTQPQLRALANRLGIAPLAPHPKTRFYFCNEGYGLIKYTSDRFGFRNRDEVWDAAVDVALIGDSFVHGACVADNESISGNLSEKTPTLSLGTVANNPIHYAALVKTFLPVIKPRWAVLVFVDNDNRWGDQSALYYDLFFKRSPTYFTDENGRPALSPKVKEFYDGATPIIEALRDSAAAEPGPRLIPRSHADHFELQNLRKLAQQAYAVVDSRLAFSSKLAIDALVETCKALKCKPVVCYFANSSFWMPDPRGRTYAASLRRYAQSSGAAFLDVSPDLESLGLQAFASKGPHLSPAGYKLVADRLTDLFNRSQDSVAPERRPNLGERQ